MKYLFTFLFCTSAVAFAQEKIEHQCVPRKPNSDISKVQITETDDETGRHEDLQIFDAQGALELELEVQYGDDMTYIAYFNDAAHVYFERDWPVENNEGPGSLHFGYLSDSPEEHKIYVLDCASPTLVSFERLFFSAGSASSEMSEMGKN